MYISSHWTFTTGSCRFESTSSRRMTTKSHSCPLSLPYLLTTPRSAHRSSSRRSLGWTKPVSSRYLKDSKDKYFSHYRLIFQNRCGRPWSSLASVEFYCSELVDEILWNTNLLILRSLLGNPRELRNRGWSTPTGKVGWFRAQTWASVNLQVNPSFVVHLCWLHGVRRGKDQASCHLLCPQNIMGI